MPRKTPPSLAVASTTELAADGGNPRQIADEAASGLRGSIKRFGDLSGIVFNTRTGELVCGHQRVEQIRAEYGDLPIEVIDSGRSLGAIRVSEEHAFTVRLVDWSRAKQHAANVAANSQKIAGRFTDDLSAYLIEVQSELDEEEPGLMDDVLLTELLAETINTDDTAEEEAGGIVGGSFEVIVACSDEDQQRDVYQMLKKEGHAVRVLTT